MDGWRVGGWVGGREVEREREMGYLIREEHAARLEPLIAGNEH
jgi:hypothetical protein